MKLPAWTVSLWLLATLPTLAADPALTLNVWPGVPPGDQANMPGAEQLNPRTMILTGAVNTPTLAVFRPDKDEGHGRSGAGLPRRRLLPTLDAR